MERFVEKICNELTCREEIITNLYQIIGNTEKTPLPNSLYLYGLSGTGKTTIINLYLKNTKFIYIQINCIECYTNKILFELIINKFLQQQEQEISLPSSHVKCENLCDFIEKMNKLNTKKSYVICLDNAEKLRDMDENILQIFLHLQKFTNLNVCTILISQILFEKFYTINGLLDDNIIKLNCPQYTKTEILKILLKNFDNCKNLIKMKLIQGYNNIKENHNKNNKDIVKRKIHILQNLKIDFYENYLNLFLNIFYTICRDLPELRTISKEYFEIYCEPILNEEISFNDVSKLWRYISKPLRSALNKIYLRIDENGGQNSDLILQNELNHNEQKFAQSLELPYYAKFLLISAFIASYNDSKEDKRLFVKNHGKQRKRLQTINANAKTSEKMKISIGPKSFTIDRLLAIFYAISDDKVGLTCNLLSQISSLVQLKLLTFVSGETSILDGTARLQCNVNLDFILHIGKILGFNVKQYLCDFK